MIIAAAASVLFLVITYLSAPAAQSARLSLEREIDRDVARAQRLLDDYQPALALLSAAQRRLTGEGGPLQATQTRLVGLSEKWGNIASAAEQESPLKALPESAAGDFARAEDEYRRAGGKNPGPETAADPAAAYEDIHNWTATNDGRLQEAIAIVDAAINLSVTSGDETFSGRDHVEANRLRAALAYHYAESLVRSAMLERRELDSLYTRLLDVHGKWLAAANQLAIAERLLTGKATSAPVVPPVETRPAPGTQPSSAGAPAEATAPADRPAGATAGQPSKTRPLRKLFGPLFQGEKKEDEAPDRPTTEIAPAVEPGPVEFPVEPTEAVPPIPAQIADLETQKAACAARIVALENKIKTLQDAIIAMDRRIKARRAEAAQADRRMIELENRGFDPRNPESTRKVLEEYEAASQVNRRAAREADLLELGGYTNAALKSDTEDLHTAAVVPAAPGQELHRQKSLREYQEELALAGKTLEGERAANDLVAARIAALRDLQTYLRARIEGDGAAATKPAARGLRARCDELAAQVRELVSRIDSCATNAAKAEQDAIDELDRGIEAAKRCERSISQRQGLAREAAPVEGAPNRRLDLIKEENWRAGDAKALQGDLEWLKAWIRYQRGLGEQRYGHALEVAAQTGLDVRPQPVLDDAAEQLEAAAASAAAAVQAYRDAEPDMKRDWTLQMNLAAAHYLQAQLSTGSAAATHREEALAAYRRGIAGQATNPDRRPYAERLGAIERATREVQEQP